jgi:uncharacterized protein (DUF305 family)
VYQELRVIYLNNRPGNEWKPMSTMIAFCRKRLWIAVMIAALSVVAIAQMQPRAMSFMHAMNESMDRMDKGMKSAPMNGDVDHDFCTMMIPHHQGAIDMAKAELLYGKDPVMRRLAEEIIVDQQSEIQAMQLWLSKRPPNSPARQK